MLAIVAPGQGSQKPGFLTGWSELPRYAERLSSWSEALGLDLRHLGCQADAATIADTAVAQPLLVAAGLASALELGDDDWPAADVVAGHSVGELTAAGLVGVLTPLAAVGLAARRGQAMAAAASLEPSGLTALLGGSPEAVLAAIERAGASAANHNGAGQIVAGGSLAALERLALDLPERTRARPLAVAGAFHTAAMDSAVDQVASAVAELAPGQPTRPILSNLDGTVLTDGAELTRRLVLQVTRPVRWDLCQERLASLQVTGLLELVPAGALAGLARRQSPAVEVFALTEPDQLDAARDFCARHLEAPQSVLPPLRSGPALFGDPEGETETRLNRRSVKHLERLVAGSGRSEVTA
ncbi:MAG: ACP S-malonyltransferase [Propionibacteriaceae bacterium]|nr:ACP S-malonyltransferase [Propionibacteriaceae bacterium]